MTDSMIIGIVLREEEISNKNFIAMNSNNIKYLEGKCSYIGIIGNDNEIDYNVLNLCDGIIIPGGSDIYPYHFKILEYAIDKNIPLLGICMGLQIIGLYSNNYYSDKYLERVDGHYNLIDTHKININSDSLLYSLFGSSIEVNSRHLFKLKEVKKPFAVVAYSEDNVIEGIEYIDDEHFVIGVQWHPEDMDNMESLYNYFLKEVMVRKIGKSDE